MKLIVGLGNPEEKYKLTRHNAGFAVLSRYAESRSATFNQQAKFKALIAELSSNGEKVILAMPTTYYNLSGESVRTIADYYKIAPADILIIHDELALPFGTIRTRLGGSAAGNNGIKSVIDHIGPDTARIRIGIYNKLRDSIDDADFVLAPFTQEEQTWLTENSPKLFGLIDAFLDDAFEPTTHS